MYLCIQKIIENKENLYWTQKLSKIGESGMTHQCQAQESTSPWYLKEELKEKEECYQPNTTVSTAELNSAVGNINSTVGRLLLTRFWPVILR